MLLYMEIFFIWYVILLMVIMPSGLVRQELKEKKCVPASECGVHVEKKIAGLIFRYTTRCCNTDLCNAAAPSSSHYWPRIALILGGPVLAVLLTSL